MILKALRKNDERAVVSHFKILAQKLSKIARGVLLNFLVLEKHPAVAVAVAVGVSDMGQVTCDTRHKTCDI